MLGLAIPIDRRNELRVEGQKVNKEIQTRSPSTPFAPSCRSVEETRPLGIIILWYIRISSALHSVGCSCSTRPRSCTLFPFDFTPRALT